MSEAKALEFRKLVLRGLVSRAFRNVVRGFSLVLHDPEGSHYKMRR